jgi:nucleotidyltransferase/DNA polymerase involved in DNA repair
MQKSWTKIIVHVDLDAFFAAVEQLLHPEWRGKPVIVGANPHKGRGRGVVSAASYEARKYGVHSAMPVSKAYQLCPKGIFVVPQGNVYKEYSEKFFTVLHQFSPRVESLSIDEAFLDMSGSFSIFGDAESMGRSIKSEIKKQTQLTASVGIAPCKSVAKIGSDYDKPDGLTIIEPGKIQDFLDPLPVTKLWGIGKQTYQLLLKLGIKNVSQLRSYPHEILAKKFGKMGDHIYRMARGEDEREVIPFESVKSVSNERTFGEDVKDSELVLKTLFSLAEKVGGRLRRGKIKGSTIHLKIRFSDFKTYTRSHTLKKSTYLTEEIFNTIETLLDEFLPLESFVRLVGVGVSHLQNESNSQLSMWDIADEKKLKMEMVMDQIQDKFGKTVIKHAESISAKTKKKEKR